MRIALTGVVLLVLVVLFLPRAKDHVPPSAPPPSMSDTTARDPGVAATAGVNTAADPAGKKSGRLRFRCVTREGEDGPPVPGAVVTIHHRTPSGWVEVGRATADDRGMAEVRGLDTEGSWFGHQGVAAAEGRSRVAIDPMQPKEDPDPKTVVLPKASPFSGRVVDAVTGRPVAGARIRTRGGSAMFRNDQVTVGEGPVIDKAVSAADGDFRLGSVGRLLEVAADGYATTRRDAGTSPAEIRMPPGAEITGLVTDEDGRPVPGTLVFACPRWASTHGLDNPTEWRMRHGPDDFAYLFPDDTDAPEHYFTAEATRTDPKGRYRLAGLTVREEHWAWAATADGRRSPLTPLVTDGTACDLRLPRPASLTVRLSEPVSCEVLVTVLRPSEPGWMFLRRAGGGREVRVEGIVPGSYRVDVHLRHFLDRSFGATFSEGEEVVREVEIPVAGPPPETVEVTGIVVDDLGRAIPGADVACGGAENNRPVRTDAYGRFSLRKYVGFPARISANASGHYRRDGEEGETRIVLTRQVRMKIRVRAPAGGPGIDECGWTFGGRDYGTRWGERARERVIEVDFPAGTRTVRVKVEGYLTATVPVSADADGTVPAAEVLLSLGASVRFRVLGGDGRGIISWVTVRGRPGSPVWSDKQGRVVVTGTPPKKTVRASIYAEGHLAGDWTGPSGDDEVTIRLTPKARLRGEVRYDDGLPAGAVKVVACRLVEGKKEDWTDEAHADNVGRFSMLLPSGDYRLEFTPPSSADRPKIVSRRVSVDVGRRNDLRFEIPRD